jgi:cysteinyl-tRNA synthetase
MLQIYSTLTRTLAPFKPLSQTEVKIYYCGPTVYNYAHIGNLRAYLFEDFVVRSMRFLGYKVRTTMNITDIEDKTIRDSQRAGVPLLEFTAGFTAALLEDMAVLRIIPADTIAPISGVIPEMIHIIQRLIDTGYAYLAEDGSIYYRVEKFKKYGQLAALDMAGMRPSGRVSHDEYTKDAIADFALWKTYDPTLDGENKWRAEFTIDDVIQVREGRPGWHIECSACNHKHFGDQIDIHMGGEDLVFPHHQNEIAQSEAYSGKEFAKYWMHCGHLMVEGKKMSKSLGNFYTLRDMYALLPTVAPKMIARGFRLLALSTRYRESFNFKIESLEAAIRTLESIDRFIARVGRLVPETGRVRSEIREFVQMAMVDFVEYIEDDINTPEALARVHGCITDLNSIFDDGNLRSGEIRAIVDLFESFESVLGIFDFDQLKSQEISPEIAQLLLERENAKKVRDFARADVIRADLLDKGYKILDTGNGPVVEKI